MTKTIKIYIAAAVFIILVLFISLYAYFNKKTDKITVIGTNGTIEINNVLKNIKDPNPQDHATFINTKEYTAIYYPKNNWIAINIYSPDIFGAREKVEQTLINSLGISKSDICQLNIALYLDESTNSSMAGNDLGLSFCPDGVIFDRQGNIIENKSISQELIISEKFYQKPFFIAFAIVIALGIIIFIIVKLTFKNAG